MEIFAEKRDFIFSFSVRKSWYHFTKRQALIDLQQG